MPQPALDREGYAIFVRCCGLTAGTSPSEFVGTIETLDRLLLEQISNKKESFFPNPYGGGIYCREIDKTLTAARALLNGLGDAGIPAAVGIAWGRFQRTANVQDWNAAALALNEAARLAFYEAAVGRVLVTPHVKTKANLLTTFSDEQACEIKGRSYRYHAVESADYRQSVSGHLPATVTHSDEKNIVLWDIVKYSTKALDDQADQSAAIALIAARALHKFDARRLAFSPAGDGGFAVFDTGLQAMAFASELAKYVASKKILIRTGVSQGHVALTKRGPVGPGVLRAEAISAEAPPNGIAILADIWRNLDEVSKQDWRPLEIGPDILALERVEAPPHHLSSKARLTAPAWPGNYIEREEILAKLRSALLAPADSNVIALVALHGMGGVGKTVLAQALFEDKIVQQAFPDGQVWVTIGDKPRFEMSDKLREIAGALGARDEHAAPETLYGTRSKKSRPHRPR